MRPDLCFCLSRPWQMLAWVDPGHVRHAPALERVEGHFGETALRPQESHGHSFRYEGDLFEFDCGAPGAERQRVDLQNHPFDATFARLVFVGVPEVNEPASKQEICKQANGTAPRERTNRAHVLWTRAAPAPSPPGWFQSPRPGTRMQSGWRPEGWTGSPACHFGDQSPNQRSGRSRAVGGGATRAAARPNAACGVGFDAGDGVHFFRGGDMMERRQLGVLEAQVLHARQFERGQDPFIERIAADGHAIPRV
eukprot:4742202-Prymnesium_polylepis.2